MNTAIIHYSNRVLVECDDDDPDHLPFVAVRLATDDGTYEEAMFTADELRQLAGKMDDWQGAKL